MSWLRQSTTCTCSVCKARLTTSQACYIIMARSGSVLSWHVSTRQGQHPSSATHCLLPAMNRSVVRAMPVRPKYPCSRCHHVRCTCAPRPERKAWQDSTPTKQRRPDYATYAERKRRKATVDAWLGQHSRSQHMGKPVAICPECKQLRSSWVADHVVPVDVSGDEHGDLRVHCRSCSSKQGARLAAAHRRQPR
jgi:hypothetical protein